MTIDKKKRRRKRRTIKTQFHNHVQNGQLWTAEYIFIVNLEKKVRSFVEVDLKQKNEIKKETKKIIFSTII